MKKHKRRLISAFLSIMIFVSPISAYAKNGLTDRAEHTDLDFSEYAYERMDEKELDDILSVTEDVIHDTAKAVQTEQLIVDAEDWMCDVSRNYTIAHIHSDLDADDPYWDNEVLYYSELSISASDKILQMYQTIALSENSDVLRQRVTDDEWEDIMEYQVLTQEQKDLEQKDSELSLKYDVLYNKEYTATIGGKTYNTNGLETAFSSGEIGREDYLQGYGDILSAENKELGNLFIELVKVRHKLAKSYGFDNYADYAYDKVYDRDYAPEDLAEYRKDVKTYMVPLENQLSDLMNNDPQVVQLFSEPMTESECLQKLRDHLPDISPDMLKSLDYMEEHHTYDLREDGEKAPGGYTIAISGYNSPFLFNCADGTTSDMKTLIHEFGHYNQMYYMTADSWYYGKSCLDLAEIHSQALEMLFMEYADDIYGEYGEAANLYTIYGLVYAAVEGVKEDAFQYAVYSDPENLTLDKLNRIYYDICEEYGGLESLLSYYLGLYGVTPKGEAMEWVEILHTFQSPLYYISYSTSVAAVFELYNEVLDDREAGIDKYLALVDAEYQDTFQNTLESIGINNPIENPRFDVYAADLSYSLGLQDSRGTEAAGSGNSPEGKENIQPEEQKSNEEIQNAEALKEGHHTLNPEGTDRRRNGESAVGLRGLFGSGASNWLIAGVVIIGSLLAVIAIAVAVMVFGKKRNGKNAAANGYTPREVHYTSGDDKK